MHPVPELGRYAKEALMSLVEHYKDVIERFSRSIYLPSEDMVALYELHEAYTAARKKLASTDKTTLDAFFTALAHTKALEYARATHDRLTTNKKFSKRIKELTKQKKKKKTLRGGKGVWGGVRRRPIDRLALRVTRP
jgi:hypothetical protein